MPRKWKTSDYDDDGYGDYEDDYGDHDEEEAYEVEQDYPQERPVSSSSLAGNPPSSISLHQPVVAQVEEPEVEEGFWGCPVCTFDNPHDSLTCDICDTPREEVSEAISSASSPLKETANDTPRTKRVSPLAKALFKPPPGTNFNKPISTASLRSDSAVLCQKPWDVSDRSSLKSKIVPFKFDTPSPDEKNIAARGLKKAPTRVAQSPDALLDGARNSMARGGVVKSSSSAVPNSNIRGSAQVAGASTSTSQVQVPAHENRVVNGNSIGVSSTPNEVADALRDMTLDSYVPESWMLQKSNNDTKQLLHLIVVGHVDAGKSTLMGRILHLLGRVDRKSVV